MRNARWKYVNESLNQSLDDGNMKIFWKYTKANRNDNIGIAGIKKNGVLHKNSKSKAEILNEIQPKRKHPRIKQTPLSTLANMDDLASTWRE